jgi:putative ABC transport system permease protein
MMPLEEAQKLFFMNGKVNNVLVSNKGDELGGLQYTDAVSTRLRVLAMDETALEEVVAILRRPSVKAVVTQAALNAQESAFGGRPGEGPPAWLAPIIANLSPLGGLITQLQTLPAEIDKPGISDGLRTALGAQSLRTWLLAEQRLSTQDAADLSSAFSRLNRFDAIDGLDKATVVTVSNVAGSVFASVFTLFGIFSIFAAIMLIFLIFVMLATERRSEMGIARAIGVQRRHLVQMFVTEGMIYDLVAAAIGVALGLAVSYAMIGFLGSLFNNVAGQFGGSIGILQFHFRAAPRSILVGYCLGVLFTYIVVAFSSWRVSHLNIVTAIRDLPEETNAKRRSLLNKVWRWAIGPLLIAGGAGVLFSAYQTSVVTLWQIGATLLLAGVVFLLARIFDFTPWREELEQRIVYTLIGLGLLVIWAAPWNQLIGRTGFEVLVNDQAWVIASLALSGPLLIIGAILAIMYNADAITWVLSHLLGGVRSLTPVLKTAIAYPLSARFRTGMTMVMFAMIIATVVVMAVVIQATQSIITLDVRNSAGFEISTSNTLLSFFNPLQEMSSALPKLVADYPKLADVAAVGSIAKTELHVQQLAPTSGTTLGAGRVEVAGVDVGYVQQAGQVYKFQRRAAGYADDAAVWQALQTRNDVAIVSPDLIAAVQSSVNFSTTVLGQTITKTVQANNVAFDTEGPPEGRRRFRRLELTGIDLKAKELPPITLEVSTADQPAVTHKVQVIGVLADDTTLAGSEMQMNLAELNTLAGKAQAPGNFYIKVKPGADVKAVAQEVERAFLSSGIDVTVMAESFALGQNITRGILQLFQGFMALGLLVGIAALGVISTRTVVERRQQIGVLRAIGFQSRMVALALVLESSFIALAGLLIGAGTGLLLGNSMVSTFFTDITPNTHFSLPWGQIGAILLVAYLFALLTTIVPAYQAARIYPAEALRYE